MRTACYLIACLLLGPNLIFAVINGRGCSSEEFPEAMALIEYDRFTGSSHVKCSATLIAPDVILTAAHCVKRDPNLSPSLDPIVHYVSPQSNLDDLNYRFNSAFRVTHEIRHNYYNQQTCANDLAILFLEKPFLNIRPAKLIAREEGRRLRTGMSSIIIGWGRQQAGEDGGRTRRALKTCAESFVNRIEGFEIQVGSIAQSTRKCFGDSGGPTYVDVKTDDEIEDRFRLAGVASHLPAYDFHCQRGVYDTRIDRYLDWIEQTLKDGCVRGIRHSC